MQKTKTLRVMKLTAFFLTAAFLSAHASGVSQSITFSGKDVPLKKIFYTVKKQTGYLVFGNADLLKEASPVTISARDMPLADFMEKVLKDQPLSFRIADKTIILSEKAPSVPAPAGPPEQPASVAADPAPPATVAGSIHTTSGEPLAAVSIRVKGSGLGTTSDGQGRFYLHDLPENAVLQLSIIGYQPLTIGIRRGARGYTAYTPDKKQSDWLKVNDGESLNLAIILKESSSELDQVQIQAYGTTSRRYSTGNISKVTSEEIASQPVTNVLGALDGRVPGMVVTQTTGVPGGTFKVEVRGRTALDPNLTDDQPLFIIDGIPLAANNGYTNLQSSALGYPLNLNTTTLAGGVSPLNGINPQDIESLEVLKDGDATAIYGSRGANGVVLITTKKGHAGKAKVDINAYKGVSLPAKGVKMMDTKQYMAMRNAAFVNDGETPDDYSWFNYYNAYDLRIWDTTRYTNFYKLLNKNTAQTDDVQVSVSGGNNGTTFRVGGSYHDESAVMPGNKGYQRGGLQFNVNHISADQRFKLGLTGNYSADKNNLVENDPASNLNMPPNLQVYDSLGNLAWNEGGVYAGLVGVKNPLAFLNQSYKANTNSLVGSLQLSYAVLKNLVIRVNAGYNTVTTNELTLYPLTAQDPSSSPTRTSTTSIDQYKSWIAEPQAEYTQQISRGKLDVLLGGSWQTTDNTGLVINAAGYSSDALLRSLSGATSYTPTNTVSQYRYNAFFGRINYNWENKYILNLSARRDGSSRFAEENRFASFGAVGAAWIFTNESFARGPGFLSFGKIRGSYGLTGNDKITNYQYLDTWNSTVTLYNGQAGLYPNKLYNSNYHWEKTKKLEGAIDLGFLKDRILFSAAHYIDRSSNQLVYYKLPNITGFTSIVRNLPALVQNSGWELTLNTRNIDRKRFKWVTTFNITLPKNKLISFPGLAGSSYANTYVEGQSLNVIYGYKYTGVDPQTGVYTFKDVDKNGQLTAADYQVSGNLDPKFYGGLQNSLTYGHFQLDFFFSFRKQTGRNYLASLGGPPGNISNLPVVMKDFWTTQGQHASIQKLSQDYGTDAYNAWYNFVDYSNGIYSDASFIRLKNLSFSYNLPEGVIKKWHLSSFRIYVLGQNLWTITGYKVGDPEMQTYTRTPPVKTFTGGLQITL